MKNFKFYYLFMLLTVLLSVSAVFPQDSSKIIILSDRVGAIIDRQERDYFGLFKNFETFDSAFFYQSPDSLFYCKVNYHNNNSLIDTTFRVEYGQIINTAMRITYFEDIKEGKTNINPKSIQLKFTKMETVKAENPEDIVSPTLNRFNIMLLESYNPELKKLIIQDFEYGISAGISFNNSSFKGLSKMFNVLEEKIPDEGYTVPKSDLSFNASPFFRFSVFFLYKKMIMAEIVYGFNINTSNQLHFDYNTFTISVSYLLRLNSNIQPYLSIGFTGEEFKAKNEYYVKISNSGASLESITFNGNSIGFRAGGGIQFNISDIVSFNLFGNYNILAKPEIRQTKTNLDLSGYNTSVEVNYVETGISFLIFI